jgi:predicted Zn-dependent protease with MMP-like domain
MSVRFSKPEFARLVSAAIERIPAAFSKYLAEVAIDVEASPDRAMCESVEVDDPEELLGVYLGTPLTERGIEVDVPVSDRIVIFQRNIEAICDTPEEVVEQVRLTVLHEIGHHFGLDEDELAEMGYE